MAERGREWEQGWARGCRKPSARAGAEATIDSEATEGGVRQQLRAYRLRLAGFQTGIPIENRAEERQWE